MISHIDQNKAMLVVLVAQVVMQGGKCLEIVKRKND
jgi:hypothetical protein